MKIRKTIAHFSLTLVILLLFSSAYAQDKPNIVLVFLDNFGWGEPGFNGGGVIRGAPTPRMDTLADEGLRLTNFNVTLGYHDGPLRNSQR
jgi:arylsulfatase